MHAPSVLLAAAAGTAIAAPAQELFARQCAASGNFQNIASYKQLPDPYKFYDGRPVATKADWECRQAEMSAIMQKFELGTFPAPGTTTATMSGNNLSITVKVGSASKTISVSITKPSGGGATGGGAVIGVGGISVPVPSGVGRINFGNDACAAQSGSGSHGTGWFYELNGRSANAGATTAWAWCVGRIIDGLEIVGPAASGIDTKKLAVTGCSRNGKGAFMVGALEKRIALTIPQESGSGGAASWRVSDSEKSKGKNIQTASQIVGENAWFSPDFRAQSSVAKIPTLPHDHHFLPAMIAPRGLFVIENDIDWLGPVSTTVAMKAGRMIYDALGVKSNMGFSLVGGHQHCQFPSATTSALNTYYSKFIQGGTAATADTETSKATVNMAEWTSQWSTPSAALKG